MDEDLSEELLKSKFLASCPEILISQAWVKAWRSAFITDLSGGFMDNISQNSIWIYSKVWTYDIEMHIF